MPGRFVFYSLVCLAQARRCRSALEKNAQRLETFLADPADMFSGSLDVDTRHRGMRP